MLDGFVQWWDAFAPGLKFGGALVVLVVASGIGLLLRKRGRSRPGSRVWPVEVCDRHIARLRARLDRRIDAHSSTGFSGALTTVTGGNTPEARRRADLEARKLERELDLWIRRRAHAADTAEDKDEV